ncbi:radical SAM protein [uncultured Anaeromusa sp.]|uniref:radical SAM protein n=1 Tax=uncultured Anaeromusa sp. TaxID=673273 RepID=UPI0029C8DB0F|nr:radical SAM protein [uncultured Anaeromusa sp.]
MNNTAFYIPGGKHYDIEGVRNQPHSFVSLSITGRRCALLCRHCGGKMLRSMEPFEDPSQAEALAASLQERGCGGVLVSGGAGPDGQVPLKGYGEALKTLKEAGLKVIVHTGILAPDTAAELAQARVDAVALDLIGATETIREVYRLNLTPSDYRRSLEVALNAGLAVSPHVVLGLEGGVLRGEEAAIAMAAEAALEKLVLVVFTPLAGTDYALSSPPPLTGVQKLFHYAREKLPTGQIYLGCARPRGEYGRALEETALSLGFSGVAFPSAETVRTAQTCGFHSWCCGLGEAGKGEGHG